MSNELVVLIIDDEPKVGTLLKTIIETKIDTQQKLSVHYVNNVQEGLKFVQNELPDIVFLDIHMPGENGFAFLDQIEQRTFELVFSTADEDYAIEAINKYGCLHYLLKPITRQDVQVVFEKYYEKSGREYFYKIVKRNGKRVLIQVDDIVFCKAADNYCEIFLEDEKFLISKTLKLVAERLNHKNFMRVNRSYLVNMNYVSHIENSDKKMYFKSDALNNILENEAEIIVPPNSMKSFTKLII